MESGVHRVACTTGDPAVSGSRKNAQPQPIISAGTAPTCMPVAVRYPAGPKQTALTVAAYLTSRTNRLILMLLFPIKFDF